VKQPREGRGEDGDREGQWVPRGMGGGWALPRVLGMDVVLSPTCHPMDTPPRSQPLLAARPRRSGSLGPVAATAPCHSRGHALPGAFRTQRTAGHVPEAAAITAPKSKIPSLWPRGQQRLSPCVEQKARATCQLFSQSIFH